MNLDLINYIKSAKEHGLPDSEIKQNLLNAGWEGADIEDGYSHYVSGMNARSKAPQTEQELSLLSPAMKSSGNNEQPILTDNATITENFSGAKKSHWLAWTFGIFFLLILGASGYGVYVYGYNTPTQLWKKFGEVSKSQIYQSKFSLGYNDNSEPAVDTKDTMGFELRNIKLVFNGSYYINAADIERPESSAEVQYTFGSAGTDFSTSFKYLLKNQVLYLNVGSNPFLDMFTQALTQEQGGKKLEWLKLDINELNKAMSDGSASDAADMEKFKSVFTPQFKSELEKLWSDAKLIKVKKNLWPKKINGVMAFGFENELDKEALKNLLNTYIDKLYDAFSKIELQEPKPQTGMLVPPDTKLPDREKDLALAHRLVAGLVNKIEIKEFETWIGAKDFQLHKVKIVSNAPSLLSGVTDVLNPLASAREKSRDAKRLADVRQMAAALELYFNDMDGYPDGKDGKPLNLTPTYIGVLPESPMPADGVCSEYYNTYWYTPLGTKKSVNGKNVYPDYKLEFCLGAQAGGYPAGIAHLTPKGIEGGIACKDTAEHCKASNPNATAGLTEAEADQKALDDFLEKLKFSAQFNIEAEYNDFGKIRAIDEPKEFYDLTSILTSAQSKSRDAKRLADVRQMASALELYFNDKNSYPKETKDLTPTYIGFLPQAPTPADGICSETDNSYVYKQIGANGYQLSFCLGAVTGGYSAGRHMLTPAGIQ